MILVDETLDFQIFELICHLCEWVPDGVKHLSRVPSEHRRFLVLRFVVNLVSECEVKIALYAYIQAGQVDQVSHLVVVDEDLVVVKELLCLCSLQALRALRS